MLKQYELFQIPSTNNKPLTQRVWAGDTLYKLRVLGSAPESHRDFITLHLPSLAAMDNAELPVNYNSHN